LPKVTGKTRTLKKTTKPKQQKKSGQVKTRQKQKQMQHFQRAGGVEAGSCPEKKRSQTTAEGHR
jgi:hypothetical protein